MTRHRRDKEKKVDETGLILYANSSRELKRRDSYCRVSVLVVLGLLMLVTSPPESRGFMLVLSSVLHTDEKLGKMFKARAEVDNAWPFLKARNPLADEALQATHNPAPRLRQITLSIRQKVSSVATSVATVEGMLREGFKYKVYLASRCNPFEGTRPRRTDAIV